jgi:hypothetical protein
MTKPIRVFLSYARDDREPAQKIAAELRRAGFEVWDPELEILPGALWGEQSKQALESSDAFVVLISPEAIQSRTVSAEIGYALGERRFRGRLIPVRMRDTKDAPWILDSLQSVQYESPGKTGRQIIELLRQPANVAETKRRA